MNAESFSLFFFGKKGDKERVMHRSIKNLEWADSGVRIGIVGCGKMGLLHTSLLNTIPDTSVVALCEKNHTITRFLKKMMLTKDVKVVEDVEDMNGLNLDAVYVTTPIPSHHSIIRTVLSKGIALSVFSEKTLGSTKSESELLSFWGARRICMVGYHKRFGVTFNKAKELLNSGKIGKPTSFEAFAFSSDFYEASPTRRGLPDPSSARGGVLQDLGCHAIDLALWYFGDYRVTERKPEVKGEEGLQSVDNEVVRFNVLASDGVEGQFSASWCMPDYRMPYIGLSIRGSEGRLEVSDDKVALFANGNGSAPQQEWYRPSLEDNVAFLLGGPEYLREDQYFVSCIAKGQLPVPDFAAASKVDSIIEQVVPAG